MGGGDARGPAHAEAAYKIPRAARAGRAQQPGRAARAGRAARGGRAGPDVPGIPVMKAVVGMRRAQGVPVGQARIGTRPAGLDRSVSQLLRHFFYVHFIKFL